MLHREGRKALLRQLVVEKDISLACSSSDIRIIVSPTDAFHGRLIDALGTTTSDDRDETVRIDLNLLETSVRLVPS